jgi:hypothetical protein
MADLKPIGSEKLEGMDKIHRILEIARYNEGKTNIKEGKTDYTIQLSDGNFYGIVNEKNGYIVKKGVNESELDYIEPMKNRKYHKSYSQAMKKLNLLAGEINRLTEHTENVSLIGEQKKFVLKTPESSDMGDEAPLPPPPAEGPMGDEGGLDLGMDDMGDDEGLDLGMDDMGDDEGLDLGMDDEGMEEPKKGDDDEESNFKTIQKLTGKLGQKLRTLDNKEGLSSEDIKYVLNSIISAVNLENLSEEDKEDILSNFEEEVDYDEMDGDMDLGGEDDMDLDMGDEELDLGMEDDTETEELGENARYYGNDDFGWFDGQGKQYGSDDMDFDYEDKRDFDFGTLHKFAPHLMDKDSVDLGDKSINNLRLRYKKPSEDPMLDEIFTESNVEKVLTSYFDISEEESKLTESKKVKSFIEEKIQRVDTKKRIKDLSESFEQENSSEFILSNNKDAKFIGKTNKGNLVFNINEDEIKINTAGEIL